MAEKLLIGIDEAGCGCMAGDLFVSVVALPADLVLPGVKDSKLLTDAQREDVIDSIWTSAIYYKTLEASPKEIDANGLWCMWGRVVVQIADLIKQEFPGQKAILDGNKALDRSWVIPVVKAESKYLAVAAASILSKYAQTCCMDGHHKQYPQYGFNRHRGYVTKAHLEAVKEHGVCQIHRKSYKPLQKILSETHGEPRRSST